MVQWKVDEAKPITVVTDAVVDLQAYYVRVGVDTSYLNIPGPFLKSDDRYKVNFTFTTVGHYIIKVVDNNGNMPDVISEITIVEDTDQEILNKIDLNTYNIPMDVWTYASRTTESLNEITPSDIWSYYDRSLTDTEVNLIEVNGTPVTLDDFKATIGSVDLSGIPEDVWTYANRTVDSETNYTPAEIWAYSNRSLTDTDVNLVELNGSPVTIDDFKASIPSIDLSGIPADVWNYSTKNISNNFEISNLHSGLDSYSNKDLWKDKLTLTPSDIWNYADRTLTADSFDPSAIWGYSNRSLTNLESELHSALDSYNNKDSYSGTSTLDTSNIAAEVWGYTARELTSETNYTPAEIWAFPSRSLTDKTADVKFVQGIPVTGVDDFKADVSGFATLPGQIWSFNNRGLTEDVTINVNEEDFKYDDTILHSKVDSLISTVSGLPTTTDTLNANIIQVNGSEVTGTSDFKADIDIDLSNIPQQVWNYSGRSLTVNPGLTTSQETKLDGLISDVNNLPTEYGLTITQETKLDDLIQDVSEIDLGVIPSQVWSYANRDLTSSVSLDTGVMTSLNIIESKVQTLNNYDDTAIQTKLDSKPSLIDIENSSILAKESSLDAISTLISNIPSLVDIREEMINVQFGGLEIANNQMTIKDKQGTVIAIFDLFDRHGNPTMGAVYKRENV